MKFVLFGVSLIYPKKIGEHWAVGGEARECSAGGSPNYGPWVWTRSGGSTANSSFVDFAVVPGALDGKCLGQRHKTILNYDTPSCCDFFFIELIQ